jgi:di/tricarboxylate transporter
LALSLSIIVLLASQDLRRLAKMKVLEILVALDVLALLIAYIVGSTFGLRELGICAGLVIIVPVALVVMSSGVCGKYFWDEL